MVLADTVVNCDVIELAALAAGKTLSDKDLTKQFFPGKDMAEAKPDLDDALLRARSRLQACGGIYPFRVTDRSITSIRITRFNAYLFLLLGRSLRFGGPRRSNSLAERFRDRFEDVVCWALRKSGFPAEILSIPRRPRGLPVQLAPALRQIATRFNEPAALREDRLMPHDNDLDVDVLSVPIRGNGDRGGWPVFQIQCATGPIAGLQAKLQEGGETFGTVWENGFFPGGRIRAAATPDDLIDLAANYWLRLCQTGWIIDRTRIVFLASGPVRVPVPTAVSQLWADLWSVRDDISWQTAWKQAA